MMNQIILKNLKRKKRRKKEENNHNRNTEKMQKGRNNMSKYLCKLKHIEEVIWKCKASNITEATEIFAKIKNMPIEDFSKLYRVEEELTK